MLTDLYITAHLCYDRDTANTRRRQKATPRAETPGLRVTIRNMVTMQYPTAYPPFCKYLSDISNVSLAVR